MKFTCRCRAILDVATSYVCHLSLMVITLGLGGWARAKAQGTIPTQEIQKALAIQLPDDPSTVVAVVGQSKILYGDLSPKVEARIKSVLAQTKQDVPQDQVHFARVNLTRGLLAQTISTKRLREKFVLDQVGVADAEKRKEAAGLMTAKARQLFFDAELPSMMKKFNVKDRVELDEKLRKEGSSLQARQRNFMDSMLGHMYMRSAVNQKPNVTIAEINRYYQEHREEYRHNAQARWEQLSVHFDQFSTREEAERAITEMAREAYFGGNMQAVAKAKSQEPLASQGGLHDWTNQGSLASDVMDQMIFRLPLNKMSDLIYDDVGIHVIRVLERKAAGVTPIGELQEEIEAKLRKEKIAEQQKRVIEDVVSSVPVWTIFPDDVPSAKPLPTSR